MRRFTEKTYQRLIETFKKKYLKQYEKGKKRANDKNYHKSVFNRDVIERNRNRIYNSLKISDAIHFANENFDLKSVPRLVSILKFCKFHKLNANKVIHDIAEYEGIGFAYPEINKVGKTPEIKKVTNELPTKDALKLNQEVVSKIDFIRIINALWELRAFTTMNQLIPTKKETMKLFGSIVGFDLSDYDKDLSSGLRKGLETNVAIFGRMEERTRSICLSKI